MLKLVHWIIFATDYTVNNINHARVRVRGGVIVIPNLWDGHPGNKKVQSSKLAVKECKKRNED